MNPNDIIVKLNTHRPKILGSENFRKYAILLPLVKTNEGISILFEIRSLKLRRQPGEICFPGGRIDPGDKDEQEAAIRETIEELGIAREHITHVKPLDFMISPFGMIIYPFAGFLGGFEKLCPNEAEVGEVFTVPLEFFMKTEPDVYHINIRPEPEENFPFDKVVGGRDYDFRAARMDEYFYEYEGRIIWGLTARILAHFITILKETS
ncbi:coenzyme A pyrophosphatase [Bacillus sp. FJAT-27225]|uniref:NUDIX hydrolase n=1 Tax=Bacillus sp. FJAT-27225 TaxID=1743144 RepID=UPI00080C2DB8|nr:CoA pyrophosphatase [Bacillus sp. FJAT-27225]OCA89278.1 coenzyme A pyrophosphatase [Bacillus sp. FJAT-27225]